MSKSNDMLQKMRDGGSISSGEQLNLILLLSVPAILAQLSSVVMQYIDASMVGRLGAQDAAAIGLVSTTTWLMGGVNVAAGTGYTVLTAHRIGAKEDKEARNVVFNGLLVAAVFGLIMAGIGLAVSARIPYWLGGTDEIAVKATAYFRIYACYMPLQALVYTGGGMLQASGNMKVPSMINILMCVLDVVFNYFLIFPAQKVVLFGKAVTLPGAGMGVTGAALGTALSEAVGAVIGLYFLLLRSDSLKLRSGEKHRIDRKLFPRAMKISLPVMLQSLVSGSAYVASTRIVSPLGTIAIAANSFAVTAESLVYMPGYGIGSAARTMIGQSYGAGRHDLTRRFAWLTTGLGILVMTGMGVLMYIFAPQMIGMLTPDPEIRELGIAVLRIEAFAEPLYAASIVVDDVFRGLGDTLVSSVMNLASMWGVRITLMYILSQYFGLQGVWYGMAIELSFRGTIFLIRLLYRTKKGTL